MHAFNSSIQITQLPTNLLFCSINGPYSLAGSILAKAENNILLASSYTSHKSKQLTYFSIIFFLNHNTAHVTWNQCSIKLRIIKVLKIQRDFHSLTSLTFKVAQQIQGLVSTPNTNKGYTAQLIHLYFWALTLIGIMLHIIPCINICLYGMKICANFTDMAKMQLYRHTGCKGTLF